MAAGGIAIAVQALVPMIAMAVAVVALGVAHGVAGRWTDGTSAGLTFTLMGTVLAPMTLLATIVFSIDDLNYHQLMGAELAECLALVIAGAVAAGPRATGLTCRRTRRMAPTPAHKWKR